MKKLYTPKQVAEILGVDRNTVYRYIRKGELSSSKTSSGQVRISEEAIDEFICGNTPRIEELEEIYKEEKHEEANNDGDFSKIGFTLKKHESRSQRLQFLFKPSLVKKIDRLAKQYKTSRNDIVNQMLENYFERNEETC